MILFKKAIDFHNWIDNQLEETKTIGFVPTMGALHRGHISLLETAKNTCPMVVCSIFVNPTQFNDPKDFDKYPITIEKDIAMLEEAGCDILFLPSINEIYPEGAPTKQHYELGELETVLDGKFRPGHFQGVCMVVNRLLDIVEPDQLFIGQKDYQQCMVITRLVKLMGKADKIRIHICPTLREDDGLAMSSRNMRLNEEERKTAATIYKSLSLIRQEIKAGDLHPLKQKAKALLEHAGFRVDYVEIADAKDLSLVNVWDGKKALVALVAAFMNEVRLIDNMLL